MSFRCDNCGKAQPDGSTPTKVVMGVRKKTYPERFRIGSDGKEYKIDNGGRGEEIISEKNYCEQCLIPVVSVKGESI